MKYKVITGILEARTALHIGTGRGNELTDALIRRDTRGQPFIPGTAIAGALRALLTRLAPRLGESPCRVLETAKEKRNRSCDCGVCDLFGDINPSDENDSASRASRLLIFNAYGDKKVSRSTMIRDGVGIERATGTAARADGVKFDLEVVPAGASFLLRIELRDLDAAQEQLLAAGLAEWEEGRLRLGGRVARGLGSFALKEIQYKTMPWDNAEQLLSFLKVDRPWIEADVKGNWLDEQIKKVSPVNGIPVGPIAKTTSSGWLSIEGILKARGPLLTNDILSSSISGFDHAPALAQLDNWLNPILTGAGLRGVLRSHAERLARTLTTLQVKDKNDFLSRCPACDPHVRDPGKAGQLPLESCDSLIKKNKDLLENGADKIKDIASSLCLSCRLFGSTRLGSRLIVEDAPYQPADNQRQPEYKMLDFLAIDRFTGGGIDGAKFDALALWQPAFNLKMFLENPEPWELGWLWLVIRDLTEGWLSVGLGSAKGFGNVCLTNCEATFGYLLPEDAPPGLSEMDLQGKSGIYSTIKIKANANGWPDAIQKWVDCFRNEVLNFQRLEALRLAKDSYFNDIKDIYSDKEDA